MGPYIIKLKMSEAEYNKLTIAQLREELDKRSLDKTGRKAELVSRLAEHDKELGTEVMEAEETEEATANGDEDMVTLDQVGEGEEATAPDAATEEALLQGEEGKGDAAAAEAKVEEGDLKNMVVIDEFDALGDEIESEMARLIDEELEAARERTKQQEEEKEKEGEKKEGEEGEEKKEGEESKGEGEEEA